mmetsp:Transcript_10096/g.15655  ORF Transcript_10096/g.15655 Transcript_10096/m.15655 type:complete len:223 (-) Transcript_10096:8-676(-)
MISSYCRRCVSTSASNPAAWARNTLPGGFTSDGLKHYGLLTNFGQESLEQLKSQEVRRRRRQLDDDTNQPYVDLFSKSISDECSDYLKSQASPSDVLARAFFGSKHFMPERMILTPIHLLSDESSTSIPSSFQVKDRFLQWTVVCKSPLELILSWQVSNVKGVTMLAFDPALRKAYHGNCINITEKALDRPLAATGLQLHKQYAHFLLDGMVKHLPSTKTNM